MRATDAPPCAHATHTPRTRHAHAMHTPCTRHARAMHTPHVRHAHACAMRMPPARSGRRACTRCSPGSPAARRPPPPRVSRGGGRPPSACRSSRCPSGRGAPTKTWCLPRRPSLHAACSPAPRRPSPAQMRLRHRWFQPARPRVAAPTTSGCSPPCAPPIRPASHALRLAQSAAIASSPPSCRREIASPPAPPSAPPPAPALPLPSALRVASSSGVCTAKSTST